MTRMRWLYAAFWLVVGTMLYLQFSGYNDRLNTAQAKVDSAQKHFYFLHDAPSTATMAPPPKPDGADVHQVGFSIDKATPNPGSFTCHVALRNDGNEKATMVQIFVCPFKNVPVFDPNNDSGNYTILAPDDPVANNGQWVSFPDLEPHQTAIRDGVFSDQQGYTPGRNPIPEIKFVSEKPKPAAPGPVFPPTL